MSKIYWITVLGNLHILVAAILGFSITIFVITLLVYIYGDDYYTSETESKLPSFFAKMLALIVCLSLVFCFLPSKEDLLANYGIGGTIDYIQSNDKAKELPDKEVDALTEYLDNTKDQDKESK